MSTRRATSAASLRRQCRADGIEQTTSEHDAKIEIPEGLEIVLAPGRREFVEHEVLEVFAAQCRDQTVSGDLGGLAEVGSGTTGTDAKGGFSSEPVCIPEQPIHPYPGMHSPLKGA